MPQALKTSLQANLAHLQREFADCADFICRSFRLGARDAALLAVDGLVDKQHVTISVLNPLLREPFVPMTGPQTTDYVRERVLTAVEQLSLTDAEEVIDKLMCGFAVLLVDGDERATGFGLQGFDVRSLAEPENETTQHGAKDGFVESFQTNMMLIRRRMHTTSMKFVRLTVGHESRTPVLVAYVKGKADEAMVEKIKALLAACPLENLLAAEYLTPFLARNGIFNKIGFTERPDTACGKLSEGRVVIIVDGSATVAVAPQLFVENFQTPDDYANRPMYVAFNRMSKMAALFVSIFLPGIYVAVCGFHPELLPEALLMKVASASAHTPFSLFTESLLSYFLYELMREAGLRVPKSLSHAVSIVGALVIGDMAVSSGLVSETTLIVIAITAIAGYVVPKLYQVVTILRLAFILIGGALGLWGITLGALLVLFNTCAEVSFRVPVTAPVAPFSLRGLRDVFVRLSWRRLARRPATVGEYAGKEEGHERP